MSDDAAQEAPPAWPRGLAQVLDRAAADGRDSLARTVLTDLLLEAGDPWGEALAGVPEAEGAPGLDWRLVVDDLVFPRRALLRAREEPWLPMELEALRHPAYRLLRHLGMESPHPDHATWTRYVEWLSRPLFPNADTLDLPMDRLAWATLPPWRLRRARCLWLRTVWGRGWTARTEAYVDEHVAGLQGVFLHAPRLERLVVDWRTGGQAWQVLSEALVALRLARVHQLPPEAVQQESVDVTSGFGGIDEQAAQWEAQTRALRRAGVRGLVLEDPDGRDRQLAQLCDDLGAMALEATEVGTVRGPWQRVEWGLVGIRASCERGDPHRRLIAVPGDAERQVRNAVRCAPPAVLELRLVDMVDRARGEHVVQEVCVRATAVSPVPLVSAPVVACQPGPVSGVTKAPPVRRLFAGLGRAFTEWMPGWWRAPKGRYAAIAEEDGRVFVMRTVADDLALEVATLRELARGGPLRFAGFIDFTGPGVPGRVVAWPEVLETGPAALEAFELALRRGVEAGCCPPSESPHPLPWAPREHSVVTAEPGDRVPFP